MSFRSTSATCSGVKVDGVPLMNCRYGINNGQYALKMDKFLAPEEATE